MSSVGCRARWTLPFFITGLLSYSVCHAAPVDRDLGTGEVEPGRTVTIPSLPAEVSLYPDAAAAGASQGWLDRVLRNLQMLEYAPQTQAYAAQNLRTSFREEGIEIVPGADSEESPCWSWHWRTAAWGRPGTMRTAKPVAPETRDSRVTYDRQGLVEWYENRPEGLEQGFEVLDRPGGEGWLCIEGRVTTGLAGDVAGDGAAIDFVDDRGIRVFRYGDLHVRDSSGRELDAHLTSTSETVRIWIDDHGAVYPLEIDPLMTSPAWIAEGNSHYTHFGYCVATAGDVNGDGYSDVIIGAPFHDLKGRAYVFHGSASGLESEPAWYVQGTHDYADFGYSVSTAGDVNADGYDDVIVGIPYYGPEYDHGGKARLYLGSATGLESSPTWEAVGGQDDEGFGCSVAMAGDVNDDGYGDVIVGADQWDASSYGGEGRAYIFRGGPTGLGSVPTWIGQGAHRYAHFGCSVGTAGDVNGDGFGDVIVGAQGYESGHETEGAAYVFLGSAGGVGSTPVWSAEGNNDWAAFGTCVATAGDVNGDGYSDVLVGAPYHTEDQEAEGRAYVYLGSAAGPQAAPVWFVDGNQDWSWFGMSVATAGDVDGDGFSDVLVGAAYHHAGLTEQGRAYLYLGSAAGPGSDPAWQVDGEDERNQFGISVATAGDVDGDGHSDVIVGAYLYDGNDGTEGRAYLYRGYAASLDTDPAWQAEGNQARAEFGYSVSTAGDVNGDGYSDVIIGASRYDGDLNEEGRACLYLGQASGLATTPVWMAEGDQANAYFGFSVSTAGDVNGDGYSDIIVGTPYYYVGPDRVGRACLYLGSASGPGSSAAWTAEGSQQSEEYGHCVAAAGDVNGDGYGDVIVGAPYYDGGQTNGGRACLYLGSASGLESNPSWQTEGHQQSEALGHSVAAAGDVNGDGYGDIIMGARYYDAGYNNAGRAYLFLGSASGPGENPAWTAEGDEDDERFGFAVAGAGDVNGDGYSDVIVGTPYHDPGFITLPRGRACVYLGSGSGLSTSPGWEVEGYQNQMLGWSLATAGDIDGDGYTDVIVGSGGSSSGACVYLGGPAGLGTSPAWEVIDSQGDGFGWSVATAGDVNGDGYSDAIIGAPWHTGDQEFEGRACVYVGNEGHGLDRIPRQARADDTALIAILGTSDSESSFRLKALGRTAAGRAHVRLEWEVKPLGTLFDATDLGSGPMTDTGVPVGGVGSAVALNELVADLAEGVAYHWRLRIASDSPLFPRTPWFSMQGNGRQEMDLRMAGVASHVGEEEAAGMWPLRFETVRPNPFTPQTRLFYRLPRTESVRLTIVDVQGRHVATLVDESQEGGDHAVVWEGRSDSGELLTSGAYYARLEAGGYVESRKLILTR